jgi:hypothetical protein
MIHETPESKLALTAAPTLILPRLINKQKSAISCVTSWPGIRNTCEKKRRGQAAEKERRKENVKLMLLVNTSKTEVDKNNKKYIEHCQRVPIAPIATTQPKRGSHVRKATPIAMPSATLWKKSPTKTVHAAPVHSLGRH